MEKLYCRILLITSVFMLCLTTKVSSQHVMPLPPPPIVEPTTAVSCQSSTSQELTQKAWEALKNNDARMALSCTQTTIKRWYKQADAQQTEAITSGCIKPKPEELKSYFQSYWALSDVGASLFIQGEALTKLKKHKEACAAYKAISDRYSCAFTWDQNGWFWKTADGAMEKYEDLKCK